MYRQSFQGCPFIMLLEAKGQNPMQSWDVRKGQCTRLYNKDVKTYVVDLTGNSTQSIKLPAGEKALGITQHYLGFQMFLPKDSPFCMTVTIETTSKVKIRLVLSTSIKKVKISTLHARIPFHIVAGAWTAVVLDLFELSHLFPHQEFSNIVSVELTPYATFLRVFSLNACPLPTLELYSELDQQDLKRNPRLPPPGFSKRLHQPLDGKLTTCPMHVQVIDDFYASLFREGKINSDVCIRDVAAIVEARRCYMDNFNQYDQYEQFGVKITKTNVLEVTEVDQGDCAEAESQVYQTQTQKVVDVKKINFQQKKTIVPPKVEKQKIEISPQVKKVTQKAVQKATGSIQATIDQLKQQQMQAEQQKQEIDDQIEQINKKNLNQDFEKIQQQKVKNNLEQLEKNKIQQFQSKNEKQPPKIMKSIPAQVQDGYCASDVDFTINAIPVHIDSAQTCKNQNANPNDRSKLTPVRKQEGYKQNVQLYDQDKTPKPLNAKVNQVQEYEDDNLGVQQDNEQLVEQNEEQIEEEFDEKEELNQQQYNQENIKNLQQHQQDELARTAIQIVMPDPDEQNDADDQDLLPDPADDNLIKDPVSYGLVYDPETGCYYEKE